MTCPHSSRPGPCSSCLGAPARVASVVDGEIHLDGQPTGRGLDPGMSRADLRRARRGARATNQRSNRGRR